MRRATPLSWIWLALCAIAAASAVHAGAPVASESDLKAAFIYNFSKLTAWPPGTFARPDDPLIIGVVGSDEVAAALAEQLKSRQVAGHAINVRRLDGSAPLPQLQVLYVAAAADEQLPVLASAFTRMGLLTVGDSDAFVAHGGAIRFVVEANRLRFEINAAAADRNGVKLGSQLLMLATPASPR